MIVRVKVIIVFLQSFQELSYTDNTTVQALEVLNLWTFVFYFSFIVMKVFAESLCLIR